MNLRRYSAMRESQGTVWPRAVARAIHERDQDRCVGPLIGLPVKCFGQPQKDHIRASGGLGMKSASTVENGALLCAACHRYKTENGRLVRPKLIEYVERMARA